MAPPRPPPHPPGRGWGAARSGGAEGSAVGGAPLHRSREIPSAPAAASPPVRHHAVTASLRIVRAGADNPGAATVAPSVRRPGDTAMEPAIALDANAIRMDGVLDVPTARRLAAQLAIAPAGSLVRIDLTHVRELHDFGLAVLAQALSARGIRVSFRGLGQHQLRLLRYLGLDAVAA